MKRKPGKPLILDAPLLPRSYRLPAATIAAIREGAAREGCSQGIYVARAVERYREGK